MPTLRFPGTRFPPITVPARAPLAEHLTPADSPVLFGCRTGLCGTCVIRLTPDGPVDPPDADEAEILDLHLPGVPDARLACQLRLTVDAGLVVP
jgi:ferredoxin